MASGLGALGGGSSSSSMASTGQPHDPVLGMLDSALERMVARGELVADMSLDARGKPVHVVGRSTVVEMVKAETGRFHSKHKVYTKQVYKKVLELLGGQGVKYQDTA